MSCREMTFSSGQRRQSQLFIRNTELVAIISDANTALWVLTMDEILPIALLGSNTSLGYPLPAETDGNRADLDWEPLHAPTMFSRLQGQHRKKGCVVSAKGNFG
jgi:hypothetical protein